MDPLEAWIFHIIPDPSGASAIWVAQRVPDGKLNEKFIQEQGRSRLCRTLQTYKSAEGKNEKTVFTNSLME